MSKNDPGTRLDQVAGKVTPERVAKLVYELEPQQHSANRGSVALNQIMDAILAEEGYAIEERAAFERPVKRAIIQADERIPGLEFVDGG